MLIAVLNGQFIYSTCFSKVQNTNDLGFYVCIQLAVRQVQSDWQALDPTPPRVGLRSAWTTSGVLCVMTSGMLMMLMWPADSWDSPDTVSINARMLWFPSWNHQCWNPTKHNSVYFTWQGRYVTSIYVSSSCPTRRCFESSWWCLQ